MKTLIVMVLLGGNVKEFCAADAAKLCPGLEPHRGLHKCLNEHQADLSAQCAEALAQARAHRKNGGPPPAPAPAQ